MDTNFTERIRKPGWFSAFIQKVWTYFNAIHFFCRSNAGTEMLISNSYSGLNSLSVFRWDDIRVFLGYQDNHDRYAIGIETSISNCPLDLGNHFLRPSERRVFGILRISSAISASLPASLV